MYKKKLVPKNEVTVTYCKWIKVKLFTFGLTADEDLMTSSDLISPFYSKIFGVMPFDQKPFGQQTFDWHSIKIELSVNGKESIVNRTLGGSTYPG